MILNKWITLLEMAIKNCWSDVHITMNSQCFYRKHNKLYILNDYRFYLEDFDFFLSEFVDKIIKERIDKEHSVDFAMSLNQARFRFNIYAICDGYAMAIRLINQKHILLEDYKQAEQLKAIVQKNKGLVLICGATGTGKSTTLAAMIDFINKTQVKHIITLEDPIEYLFENNKSLIHQREYKKDFIAFEQAIKMAMRQDPDVIMIGEIRDQETMKACLDASETGHLVLGTLHASSPIEALMRIESFFGEQQLSAIRMQLSMSINAIIVQALLPLIDDKLFCTMDILLSTIGVRNLILSGQYNQITSQMQLGKSLGMQFMKDEIIILKKENKIIEDIDSKYI